MTERAKKPRKVKEPKWQTHVYLSELDYKRLVIVSGDQCRSTTSQVEYFIRRGLDAYDKGER